VTGFVLDASVTMALCFEEDGFDPNAILDQFESETAIVPSIWPFEVANALVVAERRRQITTARSLGFLRFLDSLPIIIETTEQDIAKLLSVARNFRLSAYDAAYFILSLNRKLPLATRDRALANAARAAGVQLLP
jgi:predicted nucleic acid-binding protein